MVDPFSLSLDFFSDSHRFLVLKKYNFFGFDLNFLLIFQFSIAAINDTDSRGQWEPLAPTKEAQACLNLSISCQGCMIFFCYFCSSRSLHWEK